MYRAFTTWHVMPLGYTTSSAHDSGLEGETFAGPDVFNRAYYRNQNNICLYGISRPSDDVEGFKKLKEIVRSSQCE